MIEDDVFIGSDTQLVAPVTVRRGATIGAGTTITREAPAPVALYALAREAADDLRLEAAQENRKG